MRDHICGSLGLIMLDINDDEIRAFTWNKYCYIMSRMALMACLPFPPRSTGGPFKSVFPFAACAASRCLRCKASSPKTHFEIPSRRKNTITGEYVVSCSAHCTRFWKEWFQPKTILNPWNSTSVRSFQAYAIPIILVQNIAQYAKYGCNRDWDFLTVSSPFAWSVFLKYRYVMHRIAHAMVIGRPVNEKKNLKTFD